MTGYSEAAAAAMTPGLEREYALGEPGTLEHLLDVCQDAALGARLAAEIFAHNAELASLFEDVASERDGFATRLAVLLSREGYGQEIDDTGTFRGKLFHWRLRLAERIRIGYREIDDRRVNLGIVRAGSNWVLHAYEQAEGRDLSAEAAEEVHRQAERIRATNDQIHRLEDEAKKDRHV